MGATYVTHPSANPRRTQRYVFTRNVTWEPGQPATLHLYADTRYRLFVNDQIVTTGPVRSMPATPRADEVDLSPWLRRGDNMLSVEVLCIRANNFQAMPGTPGAFAAWGRVGAASVETPGDWRVTNDEGWVYPTPHFSFAQGPVEVRDLCIELPVGVAVKALTGGEYGNPIPADLPPPAMPLKSFQKMWDLGLSVTREGRIAAAIDSATSPAFETGKRPRFMWVTHLYAPSDMKIEVGIFWGPNFLNGQPVQQSNDVLCGNRQNATLELREGFNLLYGVPEFFGPVWGVMLGVPTESGVSAHAEPTFECLDSLKLTDLHEPEELLARVQQRPPVTDEDLRRLGLDWRRVRSDAPAPLPAREMSWDRYDKAGEKQLQPDGPVSRELNPGDVWSVVADFGTEYLGFAHVEIEAPRGTVLDIGYEERRREDGAIQMYSSNPFCDMADRFILPDGPVVVEPANPRGGRMLQLTIRAFRRGKVTIHRLANRDIKRPAMNTGSLVTSDALVQWAYDASVRTIEATLEDGYVDPWRERGLYLGDSYVAGLAHLCFTADTRHATHSLRLFAAGALPDGQFPGCVPGYLRKAHEDFSLAYVDWLTQHLRVTGDRALAVEVYPAVKRMLASPSWKSRTSVLWDLDGQRAFLDWGVHPPLRDALENGCVNALRYRALLGAAEIAARLEDHTFAARYLGQAAEVRQAYNARLWLGDGVGFSPGFSADGSSMLPGEHKPLPGEHNVHVNLLALWSGVVADDRKAALLGVVERQMAVNAEKCRTQGPQSGMAELYFLRFAAVAFAEAGRVDLMLHLIRSHFAILRDHGLQTLPEAIHRAVRNRDSLCHCWGGWPAEVLTRFVAGVRPLVPGRTDRVLVQPDLADIESLTLTAPFGDGSVTVNRSPGGTEVKLERLTGIYRGPAGDVELAAGVTRISPAGRK
jgi:alpha-L-rhamnosidase